MEKFKIVRSFYKTSTYEAYEFQAQTLEGKNIFGAHAGVSRRRSFLSGDWTSWQPSWGSCAKDNYQEMLPSFRCIEKAMKLADKLSAKEN